MAFLKSGNTNIRKGDKVRCLDDVPEEFHRGGIYIVKEFHQSKSDSYDTIMVEFDDSLSTNNGWIANNFEPVEKYKSKFSQFLEQHGL